jgi:hypothetical protein
VTHHIKLGIKSHLGCLELCTPSYSSHPKLHFDTNLIFVSLLVPEILAADFFCPSHDASNTDKICPMAFGCPFTSRWIVEKMTSFSYLEQNQKNDQQ